MVENVIENAVHHNEPLGFIAVESGLDGEVVRLVVENGGRSLDDAGVEQLGRPRTGRTASAVGEPERMPRLATIAYVVIGVIVASQHSYYAHLASLSQVLSAVVATALWPLVLLGANLHLSLGNL
jgi:hypothetical protein